MTSIAVRLFRIIFGAYFIVTLLLTCSQLAAEYLDTETRVTAEIKAMQQTFGSGIADAMWRYEDDVLLGILRGVMKLPLVVGVTIEDEKGNLIHALGRVKDKNGNAMLADQDGALTSDQENELFLGKSFSQPFPVVFADESGRQHAIGKWTVYSNQRVIVRQIQYGFTLILVSAVVKTIALWFIFLFVVRRWLATPLIQLTDFVHELKLDNLGERVFVLKDRPRHELHFLAETLNETLDKLHRAIDQNSTLYLNLQREQEALRTLNETLEQRIAERTREISDAKRLLEIASQQDSRARMKFLAKMSHEFRTPLNTVLGYAELIGRGSARVSVQEGTVAIKNSSRYLLRMIDDILEQVRGESGQLALRLMPVHWGHFIQSLEQTAVMRADHGNRFQIILQGEMPEAVMVDELRLQAVLNNLLSNANRYTQDGSILFTCAAAAVDETHCRLSFAVSDTGQGIAREELQRIFLPFVRGRAGMGSGIDGIGMGLVIAQQWVTLMGGEISVQSQFGQGSQFAFSIVCERAGAITQPPGLSEQATALSAHQILLVEDDENSRKLLALLLADHGFNVVSARSGNDARQFLNGQAIDLVITDQFMSDGDGWSVLQDWSAYAVPVILLSAAPPDRPENLPETLQFSSIQLKPVDPETLLEIIGERMAVVWAEAVVPSHVASADVKSRPPAEWLLPLQSLLEQGAVTAMAEWLEVFSAQHPQYAAYAAEITTANLMLDFKTLRRLIG